MFYKASLHTVFHIFYPYYPYIHSYFGTYMEVLGNDKRTHKNNRLIHKIKQQQQQRYNQNNNKKNTKNEQKKSKLF